MILLDTNVISEVMKSAPSPRVLAWLNDHPTNLLFVSTITIAEISYGIHILPQSKRRALLETRFEQFMTQAFSGRMLAFSETCARIYGQLMGHQKEAGKPLSICDGQIAAIALANNTSIATRNTKDFKYCGVELINPFA